MATISLPMDFQTNFQFLLRWIHLLSGIAWIGMLYWFNLVNVNFQKGLDADTRKKINPDLLSRTLWWFRWGAVVTVLSGFIFYAVIMMTEPGSHKDLAKWLVLVAVSYAVIYGLLLPAGKPGAPVGQGLNNGKILAAAVTVVVLLMSWGVLGMTTHNTSSRALSIGVGGGMGIIMFLNVWLIIWPNQKRIIAGMTGGPAAPPELARQALLASRTNAWLSIPMLFFMGAASHYALFSWPVAAVTLPPVP